MQAKISRPISLSVSVVIKRWHRKNKAMKPSLEWKRKMVKNKH